MNVLPSGVSAETFSTILQEFRSIVGTEWVFSNDSGRLNSYQDAFPVEDPDHFAPSAAVAPDGIAQIQAILKVANKYKIPLWTFSTGRNLAYGGAAPRQPGAVTIDLSRMNRILEVNEKSAYAVVEPGVSFFQLYQHLQETGSKLWVSPPEPGWASVMGNTLEHGVSYTPMGDNFSFSCGMEIVLADGDLLRTGMGAMSTSNSWQLFKYGFGPSIDGLFTQSNFGIVTKMGVWLMPAPPAYRSYMISFPRETDLHAIIEIMRPLKINNIIQNCGMVTPWTYEANLIYQKSDIHAGPGPIPHDAKLKVIEKLDIGFWNVYGAQYGTPVIMEEYWKIIKGAFSQISGAKFYFAGDRPDLIGVQLRDKLGQGIPNMTTFNVLNWIEGAGHTDFSPVSPSTGEDATKIYTLLKTEMEAAGFDYIGAFVIGWREMHNIGLIIYDKQDPAERAKVRTLFSTLVKKAAAEGYGEYRSHIAFMDEVSDSYDFNNHAMRRFNERIKDSLDPNGILSPGKQGIWPKHLRAKRS